MKFGVREICNVVFRATANQKIGNKIYQKGQPIFYIDSAKTSTVEGAATTVYATGGRGNTRLIAWEGEKTLTFTVEDALLSPISFAMLSGAGLVKGTDTEKVHFHQTSTALCDASGFIDLTNALEENEEVDATAPVYILAVKDGDLTGDVYRGAEIISSSNAGASGIAAGKGFKCGDAAKGKTVFVDYYVIKGADKVSELQIDAENFAGYYYVEADTLFRRQSDGKDLPANLTLPNVKIQSNFTFSMASSGDPSTFTFTMDAFPGYTYFDRKKKVLCAIQIVDDVKDSGKNIDTVFPHPTGFDIDTINGFSSSASATQAQGTEGSDSQVPGDSLTGGNESGT